MYQHFNSPYGSISRRTPNFKLHVTANIYTYRVFIIVSKEAEGVCETWMPPVVTESKTAIFNLNVTVNATRSITLVSLERVSLVDLQCHDTFLGHGQQFIQLDSKEWRPGHRFWLCVRCYLVLGDMTLVLGHHNTQSWAMDNHCVKCHLHAIW